MKRTRCSSCVLGVKRNRFWYLSGNLFKISDEHPHLLIWQSLRVIIMRLTASVMTFIYKFFEATYSVGWLGSKITVLILALCAVSIVNKRAHISKLFGCKFSSLLLQNTKIAFSSMCLLHRLQNDQNPMTRRR